MGEKIQSAPPPIHHPITGNAHEAQLLIPAPSQLHHPAKSQDSQSKQINPGCPGSAVHVAYVALSAKNHVHSTNTPSIILERFFIISKRITK